MTIDFSNFNFELNTDPNIIKYTHSQNGEKWKGILTLEEYVVREAKLGFSEICTKSNDETFRVKYPDFHQYLGIKYFTLKDESLEVGNGKTDQIVSSCETLNRLGYCINPNSNGEIEPALIVCIGGVWTMPAHRGKGFAKIMISKLNEFYDELRDQPDAPKAIKNMIINLYSEVGDYYSRVEYSSRHVALHEISQLDAFSQRYCENKINENGRFLNFDDYSDLVSLHDDKYKENLLKLHKENPSSFIFTVAADLDIYKWFQIRDEYIKSKTDKGSPGRTPFGYRFNEDDSHIIWHHSWNDDILIITKAYFGSKSQNNKEARLKEMIAHAIQEANKQGLKQVEFWNEEIPIKEEYPEFYQLFTELEPEKNHFKENGSLSAVRPPKGYTPDKVIWDNNTKFCWF